QQPFGPVQLTTGQLVDPPENGVAVALPLGQDAEHYRCRRGGHQILGYLHETHPRSLSLEALCIIVLGINPRNGPITVARAGRIRTGSGRVRSTRTGRGGGTGFPAELSAQG